MSIETEDDLLTILVETIRGDGQGYPCQRERIAAVEKIWPEIERLRELVRTVAIGGGYSQTQIEALLSGIR